MEIKNTKNAKNCNKAMMRKALKTYKTNWIWNRKVRITKYKESFNLYYTPFHVD